jgi:hypothetical protein
MGRRLQNPIRIGGIRPGYSKAHSESFGEMVCGVFEEMIPLPNPFPLVVVSRLRQFVFQSQID